MSEQSPEKVETSLVLDAGPAECVDLRYRAISLIDAIKRGTQFNDFRGRFDDDSNYEKAATIRLKSDKSLCCEQLKLGYRHDGYVDLFFTKVHQAEFKDCSTTDKFYCHLGADQAEVMQALGSRSVMFPVAIDEITARDLDFWNSLLDEVGEPMPVPEQPVVQPSRFDWLAHLVWHS